VKRTITALRGSSTRCISAREEKTEVLLVLAPFVCRMAMVRRPLSPL
jgi:hypothetical protein